MFPRLFVIISLLIGSLSAHALTCAELEELNNQESEATAKPRHEAVSAIADSQIRKATAAFYRSAYKKEMSLQEVVELGEGSYQNSDSLVDKAGNHYDVVNVGFGGGNSANYYFFKDTTRFASVYENDGSCTPAGQNEEFPIDREVEYGKAELNCKITRANSPVRSVRATLRTMTKNKITFIADNEADTKIELAPRLRLRGENEISVGVTSYKKKNKKSRHLSIAISVNASSKEGKQTTVYDLGLRFVNGETSTLTGRIYPDKTGGYWSKSAKEIKIPATCTLSPEKIKGALYVRPVHY